MSTIVTAKLNRLVMKYFFHGENLNKCVKISLSRRNKLLFEYLNTILGKFSLRRL